MSDWHNWKVSVDQCRDKHIGPPPPLQRRVAYLEAHRWAARAVSSRSLRFHLKLMLRRLVSTTVGKLR